MNTKTMCPGCGTGTGEPHTEGCAYERCTVCGGQRIICENELTDEQSDRQDAVCDAIYCVLNELAGKELEWDSELIGSVRDTINKEFNDRGIMAEKDFYPWIGCECEDHDPIMAAWMVETPSGDVPYPATEPSRDGSPGFAFLTPIVHERPKPESEPAVVKPVRHYSDDFRSANARMEWKTHVAEPIFKDGEQTGEWRVAKLRSRYDEPGKTVPWTVMPNRDAAMDWALAVRKAAEAK